MDHASAVVELLPRIASIPIPGNPDTYRVPAARAREVRQRLCHELLSTVPVTSLFPASIASTSADAFALLDQCDWHITMAQQRAETLQDAHASAAAAAAAAVPSEGIAANASSQPEYSKNRRGMACGHVFRKGEPIFRCHECSFDDTCVQCAMCFRHSIHAREDHDVVFSVADEGGACCDCGDEEAWNRDLGCEFHSLCPHNAPEHEGGEQVPRGEQTLDEILGIVPENVQQDLGEFVALLSAFLLETFLHAPKQTQLVMGPDVVDSIKRQPSFENAFPAKGKARLDMSDGAERDPQPPLFVALLWNDEKHSFNEVSDKILEVCTTMTPKDARNFAEAVDRHGRQVVAMSDDVRRLVLMARRIGVIYLLVTVQHAFDYYVEEVAGCVLEFLMELASCSLYSADATSDGRMIKAQITKTLLRPWLVPEWAEAPAAIRRDLFDPTRLCILDTLLLLDTKMWKGARLQMRHLLMDLLACREAKRQIALRFGAVYPKLVEAFILHDREPEHSIYHMTVQLFSVPSIATQLVVERQFLVVLLYVLQALFANDNETRITSLVLPAPLPARGQASPDTALLRQQKCYHIFYDIRYLLGARDVQLDIVKHAEMYLGMWLEFFALFHGMAPDKRAVHAHVEFESELWIQVFHINSHLGRIAKLLGEAFAGADNARLCEAIGFIGTTILRHMARLSALDPATHPPLTMRPMKLPALEHAPLQDTRSGTEAKRHDVDVVPFSVSSQPVSFHHPMHWLLAETLKHLHKVQSIDALLPVLNEDDWLRLMEHPVRVAVKLAQIRCNVWVRNGFAIRSQAYHYRDSMWMRDIMYDQDLFLQQCGMAFTTPERFLATLLDRFELVDFLSGRSAQHNVYDAQQLVFMTEELFLLLTVLLNEVSVMAHWPIEAQVRHELIHYLALGPCTYSDLTKQIPERYTDHGCFDHELARVAHFRKPDGSADHGLYELRPAYLADVQPFFHHYSRNQREQAEQVLAEKRQQGCTLPLYQSSQLHVLANTPFSGLAHVFTSPVMADMLFYALSYAISQPEPPDTLMNVTLHLIAQGIEECGREFVANILMPERTSRDASSETDERAESAHEVPVHTPDPISATKGATEGATEGATAAASAASSPRTLVALLVQLSQHSQQAAAYKPKVTYILEKAAVWAPDTAGLVQHVQKPTEQPTDDDARRKAARARQTAILQKFSAQQQSLLAELEDELGSDDDDDTEQGYGPCILCQERLDSGSSFGTLVHVQHSRLVRTSVPRTSEALSDVLATPLNLDRVRAAPHDDIHSSHGSSRDRMRGQYTRTDERGSQLGYPAPAHVTGLVAVSCGHSMHVSCFHTYLQSTEQRHAFQIARNHPEDLSRFEYVCPLCKSLGNLLLPEPGVSSLGSQALWDTSHVIPSSPAQSLGHVHLSPAPLSEWVRSVNIAILKSTPADSAVLTDHQDMVHGTGCFVPWLVSGSAQPHNPDLGAGIFGADECHMLQRYTSVLQLLSDETAHSRLQERHATVLDALGSNNTAMYVPDSLVAYTIAQLDIAQRGMPQPIAHSLSATQVRVVQMLLESLGASARLVAHHVHDAHMLQQGLYKRLLPHWASEPAVRSPLLLRHALGVLVEAAVLVPDQLRHVATLMFYVNLVQCVFGLAQPMMKPTKPASPVDSSDLDAALRIFPHARWLVTSIVSLVGYVRGNMTLGFDQLSDGELAKALCSYTLPFLRRAAILMRVVAGEQAVPVVDADSEYESLLASLQIIPPTEALPVHSQPNALLTMLVEGWTKHAYVHLAPLFRPLPIQQGPAQSVDSLVLEHPHIYELLPLPRDLTILLQQTQDRTCRRCGTLPPTFSLCLLCGEVLCEQSYCCSDPDDEAHGECHQHMKQCGGSLGLHFRISNNAIVILYQENGTFSSSPYLNSHGEVDRYLLKSRPQRLHPQRYDELRKQWLLHGLANVVTRRIESTLDTGGWITF